jgi:uridine kinase
MKFDSDHIAALIEAMAADRPGACIVGVDGGGGAGKSTLAAELSDCLPKSACVEFDDFYRTLPTGSPIRKELCWFFDWRRLRNDVLLPVRRRELANYRTWDWNNGRLGDQKKTVEPPRFLIVEGISVLRRELRSFIDFAIWVETPAELRLQRGIDRDGEAALQRWTDFWMAEEARYFEAHRPDAFADVTVEGV